MFISYNAVVSESWSSISVSVWIMELIFKGYVFKVSHSGDWRNELFLIFFFFFKDEVLMGLLHSKGFPGGSVSKKSACNVGEPCSIPGSERSPGEGNGNPLQYSCLENSMDRGAWWATVYGVTKSQTQLNDWHFHCIARNEQSLDKLKKYTRLVLLKLVSPTCFWNTVEHLES